MGTGFQLAGRKVPEMAVVTISRQRECTRYCGTAHLDAVVTVSLTGPPGAEVPAASISRCDCAWSWGFREGTEVGQGAGVALVRRTGGLVRGGRDTRDTCAQRQRRARSRLAGAGRAPRRGLGRPSPPTPGCWTSRLRDRRPGVRVRWLSPAAWALAWRPRLDDADGARHAISA